MDSFFWRAILKREDYSHFCFDFLTTFDLSPINKKMKNRPIATLCFILTAILITFFAPLFDVSIYGLKGHPKEWLSFLPNSPWRHYGGSLLASPFLHMSWEHLLTNLVLFIPIAMMIERKRSGLYLAGIFFLLHFKVLVSLWVVQFFIPLEGKAFLGVSHVIIGLFSFWSLSTKRYGLLVFALLILIVGQWQLQSTSTLLAHALGFTMGVLLFFLGRSRDKLRPQRAN